MGVIRYPLTLIRIAAVISPAMPVSRTAAHPAAASNSRSGLETGDLMPACIAGVDAGLNQGSRRSEYRDDRLGDQRADLAALIDGKPHPDRHVVAAASARVYA